MPYFTDAISRSGYSIHTTSDYYSYSYNLLQLDKYTRSTLISEAARATI